MKPNHLASQRMMPLVFLLGISLSSNPLVAASSINLSGNMPSFGNVANFRISPMEDTPSIGRIRTRMGLLSFTVFYWEEGPRFVSIPPCPLEEMKPVS